MVELTLRFPKSTLAALERIADLTGVRGPARLGKVIQDALRTYEWILNQQAHGRTIAALEPPDLQLLAGSDAVSGQRPLLPTFIPADQLVDARDYFDAGSRSPLAV